MTARVLGRSLLLSHVLVTLMAVGLMVVVVGVEQASVPWPQLVRSVIVHCLLALVWLGPLLTGLATTLTLARMKQRGELAALACVGIGLIHLRPVVFIVSGVLGAVAFTISAVVLPEFAFSLKPGWVWTADGVWHAELGLLVDLRSGGTITHESLDGVVVQRAEPRLAPWSALQWSGSLAEQVEIIARPARLMACIGFSALAMRAIEWRRPWVGVTTIGVVLLAVELMTWAMGAQGRAPVWISGTAALWVWVLAAWSQPSMRSRRPVY